MVKVTDHEAIKRQILAAREYVRFVQARGEAMLDIQQGKDRKTHAAYVQEELDAYREAAEAQKKPITASRADLIKALLKSQSGR